MRRIVLAKNRPDSSRFALIRRRQEYDKFYDKLRVRSIWQVLCWVDTIREISDNVFYVIDMLMQSLCNACGLRYKKRSRASFRVCQSKGVEDRQDKKLFLPYGDFAGSEEIEAALLLMALSQGITFPSWGWKLAVQIWIRAKRGSSCLLTNNFVLVIINLS